MQIVNEIEKLPKGSILAIGTFDGVHLGHQDVIKTAVQMAKEKNVVAAVLTFSNHPLTIIDAERAPKEIITWEQKEKILATLGINMLVKLKFDRHFANINAKDFLKKIDGYKIVVGENFSFGKNMQGKVKDIDGAVLRKLVKIGGEIVSSTRIRSAIADGDMVLAKKLLNRNFEIIGQVQKGEQRGRILGFPTLNLDLKNYEVPFFGAYVGRVKCRDNFYNAIINIGDNPTFAIKKPRLEAHLFNFQENIYGENVAVEFFEKFRDEKKFSSAKDLKVQLKFDANFACKYFSKVLL